MSDEMGLLPPELAELRGVSAPTPPAGFEDRVAARLAESIAHVGAAGTSAGAAASTGAVISVGKAIVGAVVVLTTGVGLGIAVDRAVLRPELERSQPVLPVAPPPPVSPVTIEPAPPNPVVEPAPPERPIVKQEPKLEPSKPSGGRDVSLATERALLEVARAALAKGDAPHALEALERHQREHAHGRLREEREALFIEALRAAGRDAEADTRKERFLREFPDSLLTP